MTKNVKLVLALLALLIMVNVAVAAYWVYSTPVTVTVSEYALTLEVDDDNPVLYQNVTFSGFLTKDEVGVSAIEVTLFKNDEPEVTTMTNATGGYSFIWNITETATFKTGYLVAV